MRQVGVRQISELGYRTLEAGSAKEALAVLDRNSNIDLLFTDVIMPGGMTGYELARAARKSFPKLKILLTSGYTAQGMAAGFQQGEDLELLAKPYRKSDLARKLRQVLSAG
jgi:CheY-like chemotaxis protein